MLLKVPFNHSKTMLLRPKIHVFCLVIHPDEQTNVNHLAFSCHAINIRYLLIFQIGKIFCPKFLLKARTADKRKSKEFAAWNVKKQQGYCSVGYARVVERSEIFDSIKYQNQRSAKLICDPKLIPINKK